MASPFIKPILGRIPIIGPLIKSEKRLDKSNPYASGAKVKELEAEYRELLGLGDKATFGAEAFDKFDEGSFRDINKFEKTKCPDGKTILEKLNADNDDEDFQDNVAYVKESMEAILKPTPEFEKAQKDYRDAIAVFNDLKKKVPSEIRAEALIGLMTELQDEAIKAIETQHQKEKDKLEELFTDDANLREALTGSLGLHKDADIDSVKANLMKDLEESQAAQLEEFKKSTTDSLTKLHQSAAAQNSELIFIANLHKNNKAMREEINKIAEEKKQQGLLPPQPTTATIGIKPKHMELTGVSLADIKVIKSLTGKDIKQDKPGVFTIEYNWSISPSEFLYNQSIYQNHITDMTLMAAGVKAAGYNTVTFNIDGIQPESVAMERARQAYESAINAGFPKHEIPKSDKDGAEPDHIVIMINGKPMRADELFKGHDAKLKSIEQKEEKIQNELKDFNDFKPRALDTTTARAKMVELREEYRQKQLAEEEPDEDEELDTGATLSGTHV